MEDHEPSALERELTEIHRKGSRFARRIAYVSAVVFIFLSTITGWALYGRFEQGNSERNVWRAVICSIERATVQDPQTTPGQTRSALLFYDRLLTDDVHTRPCGLLNTIPTGGNP